jgi:prevent-host-death family protein
VKTIPSKKLKSDLEAVLQSSQKERILISHDGKPCAVLVGVEDYDAEDLRLVTSSDFWNLIQQRRTSGRSIPLADVESRIASHGARSGIERSTGRRKPPRG